MSTQNADSTLLYKSCVCKVLVAFQIGIHAFMLITVTATTQYFCLILSFEKLVCMVPELIVYTPEPCAAQAFGRLFSVCFFSSHAFGVNTRLVEHQLSASLLCGNLAVLLSGNTAILC